MAKHLRREWLERIGAIEREFLVARTAVADFVAGLERGTTDLPADTSVRDVNATADNLEGTYLVRLFAAFEAGLRSYWSSIRDTERVRATDLINSIATRRGVPDDVCDEVHEVRKYRNGLVHEGESESEAEPVTLATARSRLRTFLARLPNEWET